MCVAILGPSTRRAVRLKVLWREPNLNPSEKLEKARGGLTEKGVLLHHTERERETELRVTFVSQVYLNPARY